MMIPSVEEPAWWTAGRR